MNNSLNPIRKIQIIRYVAPLREGGSLPAIAEGDDGFLYVVKFRGSGQGVKALIAEFIGGEIARFLGLKVPEIVFGELDPIFGKTEPDEEIQDLLRASTGLNLGLHYLSRSITFDPNVNKMESKLASKVVWLDSLITNIDRTPRNTNLLFWNKELWLIDHGASLYFHHSWDHWEVQARKPFLGIKDHVLLPYALDLEEVNQEFRTILTKEVLESIVYQVPEIWLMENDKLESIQELRNVYIQYLDARLNLSQEFVEIAQNARESLI